MTAINFVHLLKFYRDYVPAWVRAIRRSCVPNPGAQERHGWRSHALRGNDGKIEISLLEPSFWAAGAGQFEATTVALHLQMHPLEKL